MYFDRRAPGINAAAAATLAALPDRQQVREPAAAVFAAVRRAFEWA